MDCAEFCRSNLISTVSVSIDAAFNAISVIMLLFFDFSVQPSDVIAKTLYFCQLHFTNFVFVLYNLLKIFKGMMTWQNYSSFDVEQVMNFNSG